MNIELDWQIVNQDTDQLEHIATPARPRRRSPWRKWLSAIALIAVLCLAAAVTYMAWTYHVNLARAREQVQPVAALEAQAIASNDLDLFLALQDPQDSAWRSMQAQRFARLERLGLPELGWQATDVSPTFGAITLEPCGARLDVTYRFSVAQPMPDGPRSVTMRVPQFYKSTPSGWVRAMPDADYWGARRAYTGKRLTAMYWQRDVDLLEPMMLRIDGMLERVCSALACPPQPIHIVFENTADSLAQLSDSSRGFDQAFTIRFPSPHLLGLPTDKCSCDELHRAVGTRIVQDLVYEASGRRLDMSHPTAQAILQCELARAGLAGSPPTEEASRAIGGAWWAGWSPLRVIPLHPSSSEKDTRPAQSLVPLALAFIEEHFGPGSVARLIPAMTSDTLGQVIEKGMEIDPAVLESAWLAYTREQVGLHTEFSHPVPNGELALLCEPERIRSGLWRTRVTETGTEQTIPVDASGFGFSWSPDGSKLAYAFVQDINQSAVQVQVIDADSGQVEATLDGLEGASLGWGSDGGLWVKEPDRIHLLNSATSTTIEIAGTSHTWSPEGTRLAYVADGMDQTSMIWVADALGHNARATAPGRGPVWSPDGKRLAFWGGLRVDLSYSKEQQLQTAEIQVLDVARNATVTLARSDALLRLSQHNLDHTQQGIVLGDIDWSPDGTMLAATLAQEGSSAVLLILNADDGAIRARVTANTETSRAGWDWIGLSLRQAWSPDSRYVSFRVMSGATWYSESGAVAVLDTRTGQHISLPCAGEWAWQSSGQWLAVPQRPSGMLLVTPDLSEMHWLNTPASFSVAWRPGS